MINKLKYKRSFLDSCYDHIGGVLGEVLLKFILKEKWIEYSNGEYYITDKWWEELEIIGLDVDTLRYSKRKTVKICFESNYGILREHIGAHLGFLLLRLMIDLKWLEIKNKKKYELTKVGFSGLESLGVEIKKII
jgi:hypothetical protein